MWVIQVRYNGSVNWGQWGFIEAIDVGEAERKCKEILEKNLPIAEIRIMDSLVSNWKYIHR